MESFTGGGQAGGATPRSNGRFALSPHFARRLAALTVELTASRQPPPPSGDEDAILFAARPPFLLRRMRRRR